MHKIGKPLKTSRGFSMRQFIDRYGEVCTLQQSSSACEDCIWLGVHDALPKILASQAAELGVVTLERTGWITYPIPKEAFIGSRMYLTKPMVKRLIKALQHWVDTGELI